MSMLPPISMVQQPTITPQAQMQDNQKRTLNLVSNYVKALEMSPMNAENAQILSQIAVTTGVSDTYIDYQA